MSRGFIGSLLSTRKQRQRFFYFRNLAAFAGAVGAYSYVGGMGGLALAAGALVVGYFTLAPVVAFAICYIEEMNS
jgi:hypothetical protein